VEFALAQAAGAPGERSKDCTGPRHGGLAVAKSEQGDSRQFLADASARLQQATGPQSAGTPDYPVKLTVVLSIPIDIEASSRGLFFQKIAASLSANRHMAGAVSRHSAWERRASVSSLDFDLDNQMSSLESEWRQAYEVSIAAREELEVLAGSLKPDASALAKVQDRLERAEDLKARIMAKIERLEDSILGNT
jgi:hypothetical protein